MDETIRLKADTVEHKRRRPWVVLGSNWWPEWRNLYLLKTNAHQRCPKKHQNPKKKSLGHLVSLTMDFFFLFSLVFETFNPGKPQSYYVAEDDLNSQSPCFCLASAGITGRHYHARLKNFFFLMAAMKEFLPSTHRPWSNDLKQTNKKQRWSVTPPGSLLTSEYRISRVQNLY